MSSGDITKDPFSAVYDVIWELLEDSAAFTALVRPGNRIKFADDNVDPVKAEASTADMPEVRVISTGGNANLYRTSNSCSAVRSYQVQVASGDHRFDAVLFPVEWVIFRALAHWPEKAAALTWNGKPFVVILRPGVIQNGISDAELNRGIKGWSTLWECSVELFFTTSEILAEPS